MQCENVRMTYTHFFFKTGHSSLCINKGSSRIGRVSEAELKYEGLAHEVWVRTGRYLSNAIVYSIIIQTK